MKLLQKIKSILIDPVKLLLSNESHKIKIDCKFDDGENVSLN